MTGFLELLCVAFPGIFLLAIFCRTFSHTVHSYRNKEIPEIPTEPIVLMVIGVLFLWINLDAIFKFAALIDMRVGMTFPDSAGELQFALLLATVGLLATSTKAFWTHVKLEEGIWERVPSYRDNLWKITTPVMGGDQPRSFPTGILLGVVEFGVRCGIAIFVVLLQKKLAEIEMVDHISEVVQGRQPSEASYAEFLRSYYDWMAGMSLTGIVLFLLILFWLAIVWLCNRKQDGVKASAVGTLCSALPGLLVVWYFNYLATGSLIPTNTHITDAKVGETMMLVSLVVALAVTVIVNIILTIWNQARPDIGKAWRDLVSLFRPRD